MERREPIVEHGIVDESIKEAIQSCHLPGGVPYDGEYRNEGEERQKSESVVRNEAWMRHRKKKRRA